MRAVWRRNCLNLDEADRSDKNRYSESEKIEKKIENVIWNLWKKVLAQEKLYK